ncbi:MAG: DUF427 domain-containing protein [Deltaproteobacteria bacterium]|nr:DUF427 domain-containing protein [Deltaproteobacteria bacterium]MBI3062221.1 DUF427 domain-containing protein [Deltaproteobacteria bacterium]
MIKPQSEHWVQIEESRRRVRVLFGGATIADSKHVMLLREAQCLPVYYFPQRDVHMDLMRPSSHTARCPYKGEASYWTLRVSGRAAENGAWSYFDPSTECAAIKNYVAFEWGKMDKWMEEEEEIFVHPRDPYKRVDVLLSSRHVRVLAGGETVAETRRPRLLIETNHPVRYYVPREDVRMELLEPSATKSRCPYKGVASYWSVRIGERLFPDLVWSYQEPIPECPKVQGLFCFFQEREAVIYVDGEQIPAPRTKWAR